MHVGISICAIFLLWSTYSVGQGTSGVKASVTKSKILIGEPFQLIVEYESVAGKQRLQVPDSIPHFEFSAPSRSDSVESGNFIRYTDTFFLTSFDSGRWTIPSFQMASQKTAEIEIDVAFSEFDPTQDYHGIKDIIETKLQKKKFQWWWWAAGIVIGSALLYYLLRRRKRSMPFAFQKTTGPYGQAMQQLTQLKKQKLAAKDYYSTLIEIFRVYVSKRKSILSLQKTTDDLIAQLRNVDINKEIFHSLLQALRMSDFVKFAKYQPGDKEEEQAFDAIKKSIEAIELSETKSAPVSLKQGNVT